MKNRILIGLLVVIISMILMISCTPEPEVKKLKHGTEVETGVNNSANSASGETDPEAMWYNDDAYSGGEEVQIDGKIVIINDHPLSPEEINLIESQYNIVIPEGEYWYDSISGLQGTKGFPAAGYINPGYNLGALRRDASNGNTGVILNGRELTEMEVEYLESILQVERQPGEYWLDAYGNLGFAGSDQPFANVYATSGSGSSNSYVWSSSATGAGAGGQGDCSYVNIPGDTGISQGFVSSC